MFFQFLSESFQARTGETHAAHCSSLGGPLHDHYATTYGLHRDSILNSSSYFHDTEGLVPDIMHDCLEGYLQYEAKELLKHLFDAHVITLACLNDIIQSFPYMGSDSRNKPAPIASSNMVSSDHSLKQSGEYMYVLVWVVDLHARYLCLYLACSTRSQSRTSCYGKL